jgi:hypothetical protein
MLWDYPAFKKIVTQFRDKFGLGDFTFKQVDKFLYLQGGILLSRKSKIISTKDGAEIGDAIETVNENRLDALPARTLPR